MSPNNSKPRSVPVVEVDEPFPSLGGARRGGSQPATGDLGPVVASTLGDVLGWRPRAADTKAFSAALTASFDVRTVEGHVETTYRRRGFSMQADLGAVTGGQASLYARATSSRAEVLRLLDGLRPLRNDSDPEDSAAFRDLVRDGVTRLVDELGSPGGPRVPVVDSSFSMLTGWHPGSAIPATTDPDEIRGQLGALRERLGLLDANVNNIDEETVRTTYWTLVDLVVDLQGSWAARRAMFLPGTGSGFLGTDLIAISRLLYAGAEQVDELRDLLDSVGISVGEQQTIVLDRSTGLTLAGLLDWMETFLTVDGARYATSRDGLVTGFTPTAQAIYRTLTRRLASPVLRRTGASGDEIAVTSLPLSTAGGMPTAMFSGRVQVSVADLARLFHQLTESSARIGRYPAVLLFDVSVRPFTREDEASVSPGVTVTVTDDDEPSGYEPGSNEPAGNEPAGNEEPPRTSAGDLKKARSGNAKAVEAQTQPVPSADALVGRGALTDPTVSYNRDGDGDGDHDEDDVATVTVRGLNIEPSFEPHFRGRTGTTGPRWRSPVPGTASADADSMSAHFELDDLPDDIYALLDDTSEVVIAADEHWIRIFDRESGTYVASSPAGDLHASG